MARKHPYEQELAKRQAQFAAHLLTLPPCPAVDAWAAEMTEAYGRATCAVHLAGRPDVILQDADGKARVVDLSAYAHPWLTALAIVRYGEAVDHWEVAFGAWSEKDIDRATKWLAGATPDGVTYLPRQDKE